MFFKVFIGITIIIAIIIIIISIKNIIDIRNHYYKDYLKRKRGGK